MSGIVGALNTDGAPADPALIGAMTRALRFRGPDAEGVLVRGPIGIGHTLLATTTEAWREKQPCTIDGSVWITADARLDDRQALIRELSSSAGRSLDGVTDVELILLAYGRWDLRCVEHLLGDFAFAIWDERSRELLCARDHFGVRPFFYADAPGTFAFSNTLECLRLHPAVPDLIDEATIADYLVFNYNMRPDATGFAAIRRLPPGHLLTVSAQGTPKVHRYWELSIPPEIRYRSSLEYVEHFRSVLETAVRDRLRTRSVAVSMSGGLDSTTIAAAAQRVLAEGREPFDLRAHTIVYDRVIPDQERKYASIAAAALAIPIQFLAGDGYSPYERDASVDRRSFAEPTDLRDRKLGADFHRQMATHSRVVLCGEDADALLREWITSHFAALYRSRRFTTLSREIVDYTMWLRRLPPIGVRTAVRRWTGKAPDAQASFPVWLNPTFASRSRMRERWEEVDGAGRQARQTLRPRSLLTASRTWPRIFENCDSAITRQPLEFRWPFADRRVVDYLLAIPAVPWCSEKTLLREAAKRVLPDSVRLRRKTPLAGDPTVEALKSPDAGWIDRFEALPVLNRFVDRERVPRVTGTAANASSYQDLRPWLLNRWLAQIGQGDTIRADCEGRSL